MTAPSGKSELADVMTAAADLVKDLPKELKNTAFSKAIDILMASRSGGVRVAEPESPEPTRRTVPGTPSTAGVLEHKIDRTAYPEIHEARTTLDRCLLVLRAARDAAGVEWLSSADILSVLRNKFRLPDKPNAVGMALARAKRLVDRRTVAGTIEYRLMAPGDAYLANRKDHMATNHEKAPKRPTRKGASSAESSRSNGRTRTASPGSGLGPTGLVEQLLATGFFREGRTIADIAEHLALKKARRLKSTDLSPILTRMVRSGRLDREGGVDGYLYRTHTQTSRNQDPFLEGIMKARDER